jgi:hypothetical protein
MNARFYFLSLVAAGVSAVAAYGQTNGAAEIAFATPLYDFGTVNIGTMVKHDYVFTNTGNATLVLTDVHPYCGCTVAGNWTKEVAPGQTGVIPIQFDTSGRAGTIDKMVKVTSNAKTQPSLDLKLHGQIWRPIDINPQYAVFNLSSDTTTNATMTVDVTNNTDVPVTIARPEVNITNFTAEIQTNIPGKDYKLIVHVSPPYNYPRLQGQITLRTSNTNMPAIPVVTMAIIQQAVTVSPSQIMIPANATNNFYVTTISIMQNSGPSPLVLLEPSINDTNVQVKLTEPQPGKQFTAELLFPKGFVAAPDLQFTVKTSHPQFPVITVPVKVLK